jgi:hypothetical protein
LWLVQDAARAHPSYARSATGPKAAGEVFVEAIKRDGVWTITHLALKLNDSGKVIDLIGGAKGGTT